MASTTAQTAAEHAFGTNATATAAASATAAVTAPLSSEEMHRQEEMGPVLPPGWSKPNTTASNEVSSAVLAKDIPIHEQMGPVLPPDWTKPKVANLETTSKPASAPLSDTAMLPPSPPSTAPEQVVAKNAPHLPERNLPDSRDDPFIIAPEQPVAKENVPEPPTEEKQESDSRAAPPLNPNERVANIENTVPYVRDPSRLIAYLIPYPEPQLPNGKGADAPQRFFIYTPPLPPLNAPNGGLPKEASEIEENTTQTKKEKMKHTKKRVAHWWKGDGKGNEETKAHRVQRWWQGNVRKAKENPAPIKTFKGIRGRAEIGIQKAMDWTKSSNVEFLLRVPSDKPDKDATPRHWGLEEIVLVYPPEMRGTPEEIRAEFLRTLLATKSKAYRDSVIATGLFPVGLVIDTLCALFWPFGGLAEIAAVWAIASIRSARTARSLLKRLDFTGLNPNAKLKLTFVPSAQALPLQQYLDNECHTRDMILFNKPSMVKPGEATVLSTIGWQPSTVNGKAKSFQDEQWETRLAKEDLEMTIKKGIKEYRKFAKKFAKKSSKKSGKRSAGKINVRFWKRKDKKVDEKMD